MNRSQYINRSKKQIITFFQADRAISLDRIDYDGMYNQTDLIFLNISAKLSESNITPQTRF